MMFYISENMNLDQLKGAVDRHKADFLETALSTLAPRDLQKAVCNVFASIAIDSILGYGPDTPWRGEILECYGLPPDTAEGDLGGLCGGLVLRTDGMVKAEEGGLPFPTRHMAMLLFGIDHVIFERLWRQSGDSAVPQHMRIAALPTYPPDTQQDLNRVANTPAHIERFFPEKHMVPSAFFRKAKELGFAIPPQFEHLTNPKTAKKNLTNMKKKKEREAKTGKWLIKYDKGYAGPYRTRDQTEDDCRNAPELKGLFNRDMLDNLMVSLRTDETRKRRGRRPKEQKEQP